MQSLLWPQHSQVSRVLSDNATKLLNDRRKLESEDSSYDSDHIYIHGHTVAKSALATESEPSNQAISNWSSTTAVNNIWRSPVQTSTHDDVSRSVSETLGAEFAEHVTLNPTPGLEGLNKQLISLSQRALKDEPANCMSGNANSSCDITQDEDYNSKLMFALKLGFNEELLKRALIKLGRNAGQDKILNELIRLQKSKASADGKSLEQASSSRALDENSRKSTDTSICASGKSVRNELGPDDNGVRGAIQSTSDDDGLLPIVIDGSNVAMSHGNKDRFSCKGIAIAVEFFLKRGHKNISVFVPKWRKESSKPESPITDQHILLELEKNGYLFFTPSRQARGKRIVCHDDRYILNLAADNGGVVVSNDNYRELIMDKPEYRKVIEERILMYSFVNDRFMPPDDPLGRSGPTLDTFLRQKPSVHGVILSGTAGSGTLAKHATVAITPCPYGKKCTYGNKCKFYHAERGNQPQKSVTDKLKEHSTQKINEVKARGSTAGSDKTAESSRDSSPGDQLMRTQSMGRQLHSSCHEKLNQKTSFSEFESTNKQQLCKATSSNPRIDCGLLDCGGTDRFYFEQIDSTTLWPPSNIQPRIDHRHQQTWPKIPALDTSLPPPPPRTPWTMTDTISSEQQKHLESGSSCVSENNSHRKLARQLTLNPTYDPRIPRSYQQLPQSDVHSLNVPPPLPLNQNTTDHHQPSSVFPYPPPLTGMPPPNYHKPQASSSTAQQQHMMLTRNASAPESKHQQQQKPQQFNKISLYSPQATQKYGDSYSQSFQAKQAHQNSHYSFQQPNENPMAHHPHQPSLVAAQKEFISQQLHQPMHKTMSDSFVWSSTPGGNVQNCNSAQATLGSASGMLPSSHNVTATPVSPLIGVSSVPGVWETNNRNVDGVKMSGITQSQPILDVHQSSNNQCDTEFRVGAADPEVKRNLGPIGSKPSKEPSKISLDSDRQHIYNHLTALFPKDQVIKAMSALPEERNPEQICKYILCLKNSQQH